MSSTSSMTTPTSALLASGSSRPLAIGPLVGEAPLDIGPLGIGVGWWVGPPGAVQKAAKSQENRFGNWLYGLQEAISNRGNDFLHSPRRQNFCPKNVLNYLTIRTILPNYISPPTPPPNLAWKFFFRVQTGLTYPTGASVLACAPKSGAKLPLPCPGLTCPPSPCGPLSGPTDLACTPQSGAEVRLPCPDWPSLPCLDLWPTFRAHRPRLTRLRLYEALHLSH